MSFADRLREWLGIRDRKLDIEQLQPFSVPAMPQGRGNENDQKFPAFHGYAHDDEAAFPGSSRGAEAIRLARAFTPSQPVSSLRNFAGRKALVSSLIRSIENRRLHLVLYGNRGMGKTSLLQILALLARQAQYLVRYSSCSASSDFDSTFRTICNDIPLLYYGEFDPTSSEVEGGKKLSDLLGTEPLTPAKVSEIFTHITGTRVLLILDEFDRAASADFRLGVAELIKNLSDRATRVQLLIGGVAHNLDELIEHVPSIRRNVLGVPIGEMSADELSEIVANGETASGLHYLAQAREQIIDLALGSPYLTALIAQAAGEVALERRADSVVGDDVRQAVGRLAGEFRDRLSSQSVAQLERLRQAISGAKTSYVRTALIHANETQEWNWNGDRVDLSDDSLSTILWFERNAA